VVLPGRAMPFQSPASDCRAAGSGICSSQTLPMMPPMTDSVSVATVSVWSPGVNRSAMSSRM